MNIELATLAGGCFWCTEAIFKRLKGVLKVTPGYSGGEQANPSYEKVSMGTTGHAEVIQLEFDPAVISFDKILEVFFATHDPTTVNQQGNDVGTQYRSVIFYHDAVQLEVAGKVIKELKASGKFAHEIVTDLIPFERFYAAEEYHQNYYDLNKEAPYCRVVIDPKIQKLYKNFGGDLKDDLQ